MQLFYLSILLFFFHLPTAYETTRVYTGKRLPDFSYTFNQHPAHRYRCRIIIDSANAEITIHPLDADSNFGHAYHIDSTELSAGDSIKRYKCTYREWGWRGKSLYDKLRQLKICFVHYSNLPKDEDYMVTFFWLDNDSATLYRAKAIL